MGFPSDSDSKESTCYTGDLDSIPGLGRSPGGRLGNPLQYSCLKNAHGERSLAGYSPWGCKESDTSECQNAACSTRAARQLAFTVLPDPGRTKGTRVLAPREPANLVQDPEKADKR